MCFWFKTFVTWSYHANLTNLIPVFIFISGKTISIVLITTLLWTTAAFWPLSLISFKFFSNSLHNSLVSSEKYSFTYFCLFHSFFSLTYFCFKFKNLATVFLFLFCETFFQIFLIIWSLSIMTSYSIFTILPTFYIYVFLFKKSVKPNIVSATSVLQLNNFLC